MDHIENEKAIWSSQTAIEANMHLIGNKAWRKSGRIDKHESVHKTAYSTCSALKLLYYSSHLIFPLSPSVLYGAALNKCVHK